MARRMKYEENIGKVSWYGKETKDSPFASSGMDERFSDIDSTVDELNAAGHPNHGKITYYYCEQWQKVSRRVDLVKIKAYELTDNGWMTRILAPAVERQEASNAQI